MRMDRAGGIFTLSCNASPVNENKTMETKDLKTALLTFARQRPGFKFADYGDIAAYRADQRKATRQLRDARAIAAAIPDGMPVRYLLNQLQSGNRLSLEDGRLDYYCLEFRAAVCRAVSDALRALSWAQSQERLAETRKRMARIVGRGCANRWFS